MIKLGDIDIQYQYEIAARPQPSESANLDMSKTLCKLGKKSTKHSKNEEVWDFADEMAHVCRKCLRMANKKKKLCKPKKMP